MPEEFIDDILSGVNEETAATDENTNADTAENTDAKVDVKPDERAADAGDADAGGDVPADVASIEALAEKLGWNKDHQGPEKVDAATYILKSREIQDTMRDYNKDLKNQVGSLQGSIKALQEHNEKVYKAEVKKLEADLTRLRKEKREAVELADVEKVDELDAQIDDIQKDLNAPKPEDKNTAVVNPIYDAWIDDNKWYETDVEMAAYADTVAEQYKGAPAERVYKLVTQKVKEVFPDKFESPNNNIPKPADPPKPIGPKSPVERASKGEGGAAFTVNDLTPDQRTIMRQFVSQGIMTEKQYVADIAKLQEG
jgi:hypothetical protein